MRDLSRISLLTSWKPGGVGRQGIRASSSSARSAAHNKAHMLPVSSAYAYAESGLHWKQADSWMLSTISHLQVVSHLQAMSALL